MTVHIRQVQIIARIYDDIVNNAEPLHRTVWDIGGADSNSAARRIFDNITLDENIVEIASLPQPNPCGALAIIHIRPRFFLKGENVGVDYKPIDNARVPSLIGACGSRTGWASRCRTIRKVY